MPSDRTIFTPMALGGLALGSVILGYLLTRLDSGETQVEPLPIPPPTPPNPSPNPGPEPPRPTPNPSPFQGLLEGNPIAVSPGQRYGVVLDVRGLLSLAANPQKIKEQAERMGFANVVVTRTRPLTWPRRTPPTTGDYYLEGVYQREPSTVQREQVGGNVIFKEVWAL